MRQAKKKFAKLGALAVATVMVAGVGMTSFAFAENEKPSEKTYNSFQEVIDAEKELNKQLAAEGVVMLKNENNTLPLNKTTENKVTLLGGNAYQTQAGGGGSGALSTPYGINAATDPATTLVAGIKKGGLTVNAKVEKLYGAGSGANGENKTYMAAAEKTDTGAVEFGGEYYKTAGTANFLKDVESTYKTDGPVAIINIIRSGSEFVDNATHGVSGHSDPNDHYFTLNDSEKQLLAYAKNQKALNNISKIIVVINSSSPMEIGALEDDDAIGAILQLGSTGWNGMDVMGDILTGEINPSGKTVDFWMRDITTDPTYYNLSDYSGANYQLTGDSYFHKDSYDSAPSSKGVDNAPLMGHTSDTAYDRVSNRVMDYAEGIYMGYRYYETVAADLNAATAGSGDTWYSKTALYPFGHGLSYTSFTQEIASVTGDLSSATGEITVNVTVTNTGSVAGKDVVQLYAHKPYTAGGIEKAEVDLVSFAKTAELAPNASETVSITIKVKDLASFDYSDANNNQNSGYELETGDYVLSIRKDSHNLANSDATKSTKTLNAATLLTWDEDGNPNTPNNIFSQTSGAWEMYNTDANHWTEQDISENHLTRATLLNADKTGPSDLTKLSWLLTNKNVFKDVAFNVLNYRSATVASGADTDNAATVAKEDNYANLWVKTATDMTGKTQGTGEADKDGLYAITLADMVDAQGNVVAYDDPKWDALLNQLTWKEMADFVSVGGYQTAVLSTIGKDQKTDQDGPQQTKANGKNGWAWVGASIIASTYNVELAEESGALIGIEEQWNDGAGWYGPAMNNHRSPLSGRNFEYYSQDGVQGGLIAAAIVKGCVEHGGRVYIKHSFLNEQETNRGGLATFCNEQAIREIYAKPFEYSIKYGKANGMMTAFNLIGLCSSASYAANIQLYTNEWGYKGATVTDFWSAGASGWNGYGMVRGLNFPLGTNMGRGTDIEGAWDDTAKVVKVGETASYTQWYWTRETAHRILYVHLHSAAYNDGFLMAKAFSGVNTKIEGLVGSEVNSKVVNKAYLDEFYGAGQWTVKVTDLPLGLEYDEDTQSIVGTPLTSTKRTVTTSGKWGPQTNTYTSVNVTVDVRGVAGGEQANIGGSTTVTCTFLTQADKDIETLNNTIKDLQSKIQALEGQLGDIEGLTEEIESLKATITTLQTALNSGSLKGDKGDKGDTGATGPAGPQGPKGEPGADGSGCGGNIASTAAIAGFAMALVAMGVIVSRKRKANK